MTVHWLLDVFTDELILRYQENEERLPYNATAAEINAALERLDP